MTTKQAKTDKPQLRLLTPDEIIPSNDTQYDVVPTPEWGAGTGVRVRSMTAEEILIWQEENRSNDELAKFAGARLAVRSMVDATGNPVGKDEDVQRFIKKSSKAISRISTRVYEMNGLIQEKGGQEPQVVADAKNDSSEAPNSASPTA